MLLFKEKMRERDGEESRFVGFLFEIGSKTCVRITRLLSRSVQIVEEEEEEEDEKKKERLHSFFFFSPVCTAHLAQIQNKKSPKL